MGGGGIKTNAPLINSHPDHIFSYIFPKYFPIPDWLIDYPNLTLPCTSILHFPRPTPLSPYVVCAITHLAFPEVFWGKLPLFALVEARNVDTPWHEHRPFTVGDVFQRTLIQQT